jgi:hypothetical protein
MEPKKPNLEEMSQALNTLMGMTPYLIKTITFNAMLRRVKYTKLLGAGFSTEEALKIVSWSNPYE